MDSGPSRKRNLFTLKVNKKMIANTPLLLVFCLEIILIIILIIPITINTLNRTGNQQATMQAFSEEQELSNGTSEINRANGADGANDSSNPNESAQELPDTRPYCDMGVAKEEPFVSIKMDYPYAGIMESTGKYLCNTDLGYKVSIPREITKVFYYIVNGGQMSIVGLMKDGNVLAAPITQTNFSAAWAGTIMGATQESVKEIQDNPDYSNFKIVLNDVTPEIMKNESSDEETQAMIRAFYGDNVTFSILYSSPINPYEHTYANEVPTEMLEEIKRTYDNRNQELIDEVERIFANPENYSKLETN